jgi:hypothetical protein
MTGRSVVGARVLEKRLASFLASPMVRLSTFIDFSFNQIECVLSCLVLQPKKGVIIRKLRWGDLGADRSLAINIRFQYLVDGP